MRETNTALRGGGGKGAAFLDEEGGLARAGAPRRSGGRGRRAPRRGGCWGTHGWLSPSNVGAEARGRTAERVEGDESFHEQKF